jgi:predicted metal-binding membrane protein
MGSGSLEAVLQRDRTIVGVALAGMVLLSWTYILVGAGTGMTALEMSGLSTAIRMSDPMTAMPMGAPMATMPMGTPMAAMQPIPWTVGYALIIFVMWWLMMLATMLPSATPMILLFAALTRKRLERRAPYTGTGLFGCGYLAVWGGFSVLAVSLQWQLDRIALLSPMMVTTSLALGALLLIGAGVWQFTPLKHACLRHCRSPAEFLTGHWRDGKAGAFLIGVRHGAYCLGCCWMLMLLLFYGGIMNIFWIAGLAILVLIEKITSPEHWISSAIGVTFIVWGGTLLAGLIR